MANRSEVLSVLAIAASACALLGSERTDPLPRPGPDQVHPSKYEPERPFESVAGVSSRTAYSTRTDSGYHIEVRDFLFAQSDAPAEVPLISQNAALVEVREGNGVAIIGGNTVQLSPGFVFTVPEGTPLRVQAKGEPLSFRVHLYRQQ